MKSMKISNDTTGNRTRNLPAYSAMLQPTAPPRSPIIIIIIRIIIINHTEKVTEHTDLGPLTQLKTKF
jgi:hypothetical protein